MAMNVESMEIEIEVRPRWWLGWYLSGLAAAFRLGRKLGWRPSIPVHARFIARHGYAYLHRGREI